MWTWNLRYSKICLRFFSTYPGELSGWLVSFRFHFVSVSGRFQIQSKEHDWVFCEFSFYNDEDLG